MRKREKNALAEAVDDEEEEEEEDAEVRESAWPVPPGEEQHREASSCTGRSEPL